MGCMIKFYEKVRHAVYGALCFMPVCTSCFIYLSAGIGSCKEGAWAPWHLICVAWGYPSVAGLSDIIALPDIIWLI